MKADEIWQAALGELQLQLTKATFDTWLKNTRAVSYEDGTFVVAVENAFARDWLQNRLLSVIKRTVCAITRNTVELRFTVRSRSKREPAASEGLWVQPAVPEGPSPRKPGNLVSGNLNPRYVFDCFIVGSGNRLAHAASVAVADRPGSAYNPLFIYGGVGLGKTHLLHAIGHSYVQLGLRVLYASSEQFTNELIASIRSQSTSDFRSKYRTMDILLVDDIQFIAGKESTQEEFFHTFNALHEANRQVVISSDRPPKAILTLEERLLSRFEWGLIADIQPPDFETRIAILQSKAHSHGRDDLSNEVFAFIAERVQSNIRELEGHLTRVLAYADLVQADLDLAVAREALEDIQPSRCRTLTERQVIDAVAAHYQLDSEALTGPSRQRSISLPRQVAMYLMREEAGCSLPNIGHALGGRDHTTVMHGCTKISQEIDRDHDLRRRLDSIKRALYEA